MTSWSWSGSTFWMNFFAASTLRFSRVRYILFRTTLRQYVPSSFGCTTVTSELFSSSYRRQVEPP